MRDLNQTHHRALRAAQAVTGRRAGRMSLLAAGAIALFGLDVAGGDARANAGFEPDHRSRTMAAGADDRPTVEFDDQGRALVAQAKGCFSWGPPAPPSFEEALPC